MSLFVLSYAQTLLTRTSESSLILNVLSVISIIEGNPQTLPQIRIDDVEAAESCLNVTAIICLNNLRLIMICRLVTCVRSIFYGTGKWLIRWFDSRWSTDCAKFESEEGYDYGYAAICLRLSRDMTTVIIVIHVVKAVISTHNATYR
jgi:hypothetical protein